MRIAALIALSWVMQPVSLQAAGCSDAWIQAVEKQLSVGDGQGHGPDLGSDEWRMVIERRLGPDPANLPDRSSDAWCDAVSQRLQKPTYDCAKASGSVETLICEDPELADLVVVTDDNPRDEDPAAIRAAILAGAGTSGRRPEVAEIGDRRSAIEHAVAWARRGDVVVIAGKGHERGQTGGGQTRPFDDREELARALEMQVAR